jgi:hypothetical protein
MVEKSLAENRLLLEPLMAKKASPATVRLLIREFETQVVRLALSKGPRKTFAPGVSGKLDADKLKLLRTKWLLFVQGSCEVLKNLASEAGIDLETEAEGLMNAVVEAANFKDHKFTKSVHTDFLEQGFYLGCEVYLKNRITIVIDPDTKFRKNIIAGAKGVIKGVLGDRDDQLVVSFQLLNQQGDPITKDVAVKTSNLLLEADCTEEEQGAKASGSSGKQSQA